MEASRAFHLTPEPAPGLQPKQHVPRERQFSCSDIYHTRQELLAQIDNTNLEQEQLRELQSPDEADLHPASLLVFRSR